MTEAQLDQLLCAARYRWLRKKYAAGELTYLAESIFSEDQMDDEIDLRMKGKGEEE